MGDLQTIGDYLGMPQQVSRAAEGFQFETFAHAPVSAMESCRATGGGEHLRGSLDHPRCPRYRI